MSVLFEPVKIGNFETRNRFVRSATYFALADKNGFIGEPSVTLMKNLAEGGVGLIITGYAYVSKSGQSFVDMNGIHTDEHVAGYKKMTRAVHDAGGRLPCRSPIAALVRKPPHAPAGTIWLFPLPIKCPITGTRPAK